MLATTSHVAGVSGGTWAINLWHTMACQITRAEQSASKGIASQSLERRALDAAIDRARDAVQTPMPSGLDAEMLGMVFKRKVRSVTAM